MRAPPARALRGSSARTRGGGQVEPAASVPGRRSAGRRERRGERSAGEVGAGGGPARGRRVAAATRADVRRRVRRGARNDARGRRDLITPSRQSSWLVSDFRWSRRRGRALASRRPRRRLSKRGSCSSRSRRSRSPSARRAAPLRVHPAPGAVSIRRRGLGPPGARHRSPSPASSSLANERLALARPAAGLADGRAHYPPSIPGERAPPPPPLADRAARRRRGASPTRRGREARLTRRRTAPRRPPRGGPLEASPPRSPRLLLGLPPSARSVGAPLP